MTRYSGKRPQEQSRRDSSHADLTAPLTLHTEGELRSLLHSDDPQAIVLVLDGVQDPQNLGACLRTADAAGVAAVIFPKDRAVGITQVVRNIASGAAESTPLVQVTNLARTLGILKELGFWVMGTADQADKDLYEADLTGRLALVMGAEGKGLRRLTSDCCDLLLRIPMRGSVPCLNVSAAAAVCLYEAVRQRLLTARQ